MNHAVSGIEPISIDIPEACRLSGLGRSKIYELISAGHIESIKVGKRRLIRVQALRDFLDRLAEPRDEEAA